MYLLYDDCIILKNLNKEKTEMSTSLTRYVRVNRNLKSRGECMIEIQSSPLGNGAFNRGVFATETIKAGTLLHAAPIIAYSNEEHDEHIAKTLIGEYAFAYGEHESALLLGYGMLFNHSYEPNARYEINVEHDTFDFYAYTDITAGTEVCINYHGEVENDDPLWFEDASEA